MQTEIFGIIKYLLASAVVFSVVYYLLKVFFNNEQKKKILDIKANNQQYITPVRLQAYERMILFLERISVYNLIPRVNQSGYSAFQLQKAMIQAIRDEYDHNLSQQLYISSEAWDHIRRAREESIRMINMSVSKLDSNASGSELAASLFDLYEKTTGSFIQSALDTLKKEIAQFY